MALSENSTLELQVRTIRKYRDGVEGFLSWMRALATIPVSGEQGGAIMFKLWPEQQRVARGLFSHDLTIILKARQLGMTWLVLYWFLWRSLYWDNREHRIVSINEEAAKRALSRVKWAWMNLPDWARGQIERDNTMEIKFLDTGSIITALPATANAGRGDTLDGLLLDEDAQQIEGKEIIKSALPALEKRKGVLVRLSTACGFGNDFEQTWHKALRGEGGYNPIFLPWTADPDRNKKWYDKLLHEQGEEYMHQEYPLTPAEAFLASGRPFFEMANLHEDLSAEPEIPIFGDLYDGEFTPEPGGPIQIWRAPDHGKQYVLFVDVSEGLEKGDWSHGVVVGIGDAYESAALHVKCDPAELAERLWDLSHYYFTKLKDGTRRPALTAPEANSFGLTTALALRDRGHTNLYFDRDLETGEVKDRPGWYTSEKTRRIMLGHLQQAYRKREIRILDRHCLEEMAQFWYRGKNKSKPQAPPGGFDDRVMALAGARTIADRIGGIEEEQEKFLGSTAALSMGIRPTESLQEAQLTMKEIEDRFPGPPPAPHLVDLA